MQAIQTRFDDWRHTHHISHPFPMGPCPPTVGERCPLFPTYARSSRRRWGRHLPCRFRSIRMDGARGRPLSNPPTIWSSGSRRRKSATASLPAEPASRLSASFAPASNHWREVPEAQQYTLFRASYRSAAPCVIPVGLGLSFCHDDGRFTPSTLSPPRRCKGQAE